MKLIWAAAITAVLLVGCGGGSSKGGSTNAAEGTSGLQVPTAGRLTNAGAPVSISFWNAKRGLAAAGKHARGQCVGTVSETTDGGHSFEEVLSLPEQINWIETAGTHDAWAQTTAESGCRPSRLLHSADNGKTWHELPATRVLNPSFSSPTRGLALQANGRDGIEFDNAWLLRTSDGGKSWHRLRAPCPHPMTGANATAATAAKSWVLCIGQPGAGNQSKAVYSSSDDLESWQQLVAVALPGSPGAWRLSSGGISSYGYPSGFTFSEGGMGVLWEGRGTTFLTQDGGAHWRPLTKVTEPERNFGESASVPDSTHAFLLQTAGTKGASVVLMATTDGGASWIPVHAWRAQPGY